MGLEGAEEESTCHLPNFDGLPKVDHGLELIAEPRSDVFREICLGPESGQIVRQDCPNKLFVFTTRLGMRLEAQDPKMIIVDSRQDCQHR